MLIYAVPKSAYCPVMIANALISLIRLYQGLAPVAIRARCRFEPSCSNYAILALEKYTTLYAIRLIIDRLHRCRYPNGGDDYP